MRAARMASARVLICCSPNMSFRRSAFLGNFRKFLEISGGRRSAVGGRLRSAVGLPPPEVKFPWKFLDPCFLSRGQISKRISRNLCLGQIEPPFSVGEDREDVEHRPTLGRIFRLRFTARPRMGGRRAVPPKGEDFPMRFTARPRMGGRRAVGRW